MKRLKERIKKEFTEPIPKAAAVFLCIAGLFMGTVFTAGMHFWEARVTKADAIRVTATFASYKKTYKRGHIKEIIIRFKDYEQMTIDGVCLSDEVVRKVETLETGTVLNLYVHPNSSTILEMVSNGEFILVFDEVMEQLSSEVSAFTVLGVFMYLCAAFGAFKLIRRDVF